MNNQEIVINLDNGRNAVIRGVMKNRERLELNKLLASNSNITQEDLQKNGGNINIDVSSALELGEKIVKMLLISYCGNTENPFEALMDSEYGDDYAKISEAVQEVFRGESLPKE